MTAKKTDIWMPLYVAEYLSATMFLTTEQHGAYMLMLMACWKDDGRIPSDDDSLCSITKLPLASLRRHRPKLIAFFDVDGEWLVHGRVVKERVRAQVVSAARSEAGKSSAASKKQKAEETKNKTPTIVAANIATEVQQNATQSQSPTTSVPIGTGGKPPPADAKTIVFANGVPLLLASGVPEKNARSMLAHLCKQHGDEAVADALQRCAETGAVEPVSWLQATLRSKSAPAKRFDNGIGAAARTAFEMPFEREVIDV